MIPPSQACSQMASTLGYIWRHPAVRDERGRAIGRYIGWQLWQRASRRPLTVTLHGNIRLRCHPHSTSASAVLYCRLPDWHEMRFLLDHLRPGDTFVDVGANVGVYTLLAAAVPGVRCVAFEPSTQSWTRLVENIRLNGLTEVDARRAAVGAESGEAAITVGRDSVNRVVGTAPGQGPPDAGKGEAGKDEAGKRDAGPLEERQADGGLAGGAEWVPLTTLDEALAGVDRVALVKIDVEGMEPAVLRGAREILRRHSPAMIIERNDPVVLGRALAEVGYASFRYDPAARRPVPVDLSRERIHNVLALPQTPGEPSGAGTAAAATHGDQPSHPPRQPQQPQPVSVRPGAGGMTPPPR